MQVRTGRRILTILMSVVIAVCAGSAVQAEEEAEIFTEAADSGIAETKVQPEESSAAAAGWEEDVTGGEKLETSSEDSGMAAGWEEDRMSAEKLEDLPEISEMAAGWEKGGTSGEKPEVSGMAAGMGVSEPSGADAGVEIISVGEAVSEIPAPEKASADELQIAGEVIVNEISEGINPETEISEDMNPGITVLGNPDEEITYIEERTLRGGDADDGAASRSFMRSTLEYECCYGDQLVGESRKIYDSLVSGWASGNTGDIAYHLETPLPCSEVNVNQISHNAQAAFDAFLYDYPEVFWLRDVTVSIGRSSSNLLVSILLRGNERYVGARSEVEEFRQAVEKETGFIRSMLPGDADRYTIVKTIHDYICETTEYDYLKINYTEVNGHVYNDTAHTAAGIFLKDRIVVCEGYAKAFKILCRQFGIECALIIGRAGGENHMWNYVKMDDGKWYLVDTTWDDQSGGIRDTYLLAGSLSQGFTNLVWEERQSWTDFSGSEVKNFVLPVLNAYTYERKNHQWLEILRTSATCRSYETAQYRCEICGEIKTEIIGPEVEHDWSSYVSNNDATWQQDGTKTAVCQYGCGEKKTVTDVGSRLPRTIKINVSSLCLRVGQSSDAVKVTLAKGDKVVSWKSSNQNIVSVNKKGKITAGMKTGEAVVTLATLSGMTKKITVTVQKETVETTGITGLSKKVTLKKGKMLQLTPVIEPVTSLQKVTYSSSNKKVADVTAKGLITAKKAGTAKITVKSGSMIFKVTVKVKKP